MLPHEPGLESGALLVEPPPLVGQFSDDHDISPPSCDGLMS
jgi:hypothetical protein